MPTRVLIASSSLLALPTYEALVSKKEFEVVGLLSTPNRPKGRHGTPSPNELVEEFEKRGLQVWKPNDSAELLGLLDEIAPQLVVVIAYGRLIKEEALKRVPLGWLNLHFSLLPAYRGAAPVQRAILNGDESFGVTVFQLDEGMDTGPYFVRAAVETAPGWSATEILAHLSQSGSSAVLEATEMLLAGTSPVRQSGEVSQAPKIRKDELRLDLRAGSKLINRQIRAFTHSPGVWFIFRGRRHVITSATLDVHQLAVGKVMLFEGRALLGTGDGSMEIRSLVPEGKREMTGSEWIRGLHLSEGQSIEDGVEL